MTVAVYGNLIYDTIVTTHKLCPGASHQCSISYRVGGLANFCRAAADLYKTVAMSSVGNDPAGRLARAELESCVEAYVTIENAPTTQAIVIADKTANNRTGLVEWGACRRRAKWAPWPLANWHHLMYLDRLTIADLSVFTGGVSADFCDSREIVNYLHLLPYIDYLIVSELEEGSLRGCQLPVRKGVIVHGPGHSYVMNSSGSVVDECLVKCEVGLNVIGAGDYFAANCLANLLVGDPVALDQAHQQTLAFLRNQS